MRFQPLLLAIGTAFCFSLQIVQAQPDTWVTSFGSKIQDAPEDILVDDAGNSYVCGFFRDTLVIGTTQLVSAGKNDIFLAKFDPLGQLAWAKRYGWYANDFSHGLTFDHSGNVILVGEYQDSTIFENDTLHSLDSLWYGAPAETYDVFWLRVTPSGTMEKIWADGWHGSENWYEVEVGPDSLYYFAGFYRTFNRWTFDDQFDPRGIGRGYDDAIWVRSDTSGDMDYKAIAEGKYVDRGQALGLIGDSLVIMGGTFQDTCYFIDSVLYRVTGFEDDVFVACYGDTGTYKWVVNGGSKAIDELNALVTDANGNIYFGGAFDSAFTMQGQTIVGSLMLDGYIGKIDMNGNVLWLKKVGGDGFDVVRDVRLAQNGDLLITGYFQRDVDLGGGVMLSLADSLDQNAFVARLDASGNAIWAKSLGGISPDLGVAMDEDAAGYIYALGTFTGEGHFGQDTAFSAGGEDVYLLRMNADGAVNLPSQNPAAISDVSLWPNPTMGEVHVAYELHSASDVQMDLLDLNGRVLMSQDLGRKLPGRGETTLDGRALPSGFYLLRLSTNAGNFTARVAISR